MRKAGAAGRTEASRYLTEMPCAKGRGPGEELCHEYVYFEVGRGRNQPVSWK